MIAPVKLRLHHDRLTALLDAAEARGVPRAAVARAVGVHKSQPKRWETGDAKSLPRADTFLLLTRELGTTWAHLFDVENDPDYRAMLRAEIAAALTEEIAVIFDELRALPASTQSRIGGRIAQIVEDERGRQPSTPGLSLVAAAPRPVHYPVPSPAIVFVPYYRIAAGQAIEAITDTDETIEVPAQLLAEHRVKPGECYALRLYGESMSGDDLHDGDVVLVRRNEVYSRAGIFVVFDPTERRATLKRIKKSKRAGTAMLIPSNPDMQPVTVSIDDAQPQGEYLCVIRRAGDEPKKKGKR